MIINQEILLLLIGAGIALVSSLVTSFVNHLLSLRVDRIKRERDKADLEAIAIRKDLSIDTRNVITPLLLQMLEDINNSRNKQLKNAKVETDDNYKAYELLRTYNDWLEQNLGLYVAFAHGKYVDHDSQKIFLVERLRKIHLENEILILKVEKKDHSNKKG